MHGGAANLPITSAFQDFLSRLNKINQIKGAEHALKQVEGNTICSTKHQQLTNKSHLITTAFTMSSPMTSQDCTVIFCRCL